jgi:hypothetical protein
MKLKEGIDPSALLRYGFKEVTQDHLECWVGIYSHAYYIGHSRMSQYYYILVSIHEVSGSNVFLRATEPNGGGGSIALPSVLADLIKDGIIV